jgi:hypothetical protein
MGATSARVAWDDPRAVWSGFSHVLISSTWDSVDRPDEYLEWTRKVSGETHLVNSGATIEWGIDKVHQCELAAAGVPIIPTTWVAPGESWAPSGAADFVIKPSVSAGGRNTARYAAGDVAAGAHVQALQLAGQTVMVQDYMARIDTQGEINLIYLGGEFSHGVLKMAALKFGRGVVDRPWERMAWTGLVTPSADQLTIADQTIAFAAERLGAVPVYGRVDLVEDDSGAPRLLELELVDPYLALDLKAGAADRLVAALLRQ